MILLIDNYDSFTYNLFQLIEQLGHRCEVRRNDEVTLEQIADMSAEGILISPGPGAPAQAGITVDVIRHFAGHLPIFGVCLGHQAIGEAFGAKVIRAPKPLHGKKSGILHDGQGIFQGMPPVFQAARYHSLMIEESTLPSCLKVTARTADGLIMGVRHAELPIEGVQFHPESIATEGGARLLENFLSDGPGRVASAKERACG